MVLNGPDVIEFKIIKPLIFNAKRKERTTICKISFLSKGLEVINVLLFSHDPSVKAYLPIDIKFDDPTVVYSLNKSISSNVINFINSFTI